MFLFYSETHHYSNPEKKNKLFVYIALHSNFKEKKGPGFNIIQFYLIFTSIACFRGIIFG